MTICKRSGLARISGFSLLEVLLSLALASVILLAASQLLQALMQRAHWWQLLSQMVVTRQSVEKSFALLAAQVCQSGLIMGASNHWRWHLQPAGSCELYDVRLRADKQQLQKRRLGGRYTSFIDSISALRVSYGVSGQGDCVVRQWLPEVSDQLAQQTVLLRLQFAVGVPGQPPVYGLPVGWHFDNANDLAMLWQTSELVVGLPCTVVTDTKQDGLAL
ncbi:MAG: prepilin-type N-terminal cleavage/methylation domain-containing protein [Gammaproteobacteria bacterium]|jgi:prepilin-type N-terminal cleavage/methylation domain-containing protein|nr:prepilin-type N-terminal cleavage/methylation domain-containing protein [Gammaproteobacteria bacterium]